MASTAHATMWGQVENKHGACGRVNARGRLAQGPAHNAALCSSLERGLSVVMWPASRRAGGPAGRASPWDRQRRRGWPGPAFSPYLDDSSARCGLPASRVQ